MSEKIFILTGESSGEMYGASLVKELLKLNKTLKISGVGSVNLQTAGADIIFDYSEINYIGFSSIAKNIFKIKKKLNECISFIKNDKPTAVILIDFPGFNLKLIKEIRKFYTGKIIYYISPQLWAWHKERIKIIQKFVDKILVIFPFEVDFYKKENVDAEYVGHPLKEKTDEFISLNKKKKEDGQKLTLTLMPGSRKEEVERILPVLLEASDKLKDIFDLKINILCSGNIELNFYSDKLNNRKINLIYDDGTKIIEFRTIFESDLLFTKSGTSTVECALLKSPFCIVYKTGSLNYLIGKYFIKLKNIGMVNILLKDNVVKEFIQHDCNADNLFQEGKLILTNKPYRDEMINNFNKLDILLGNKKASEIVAKSILELIG